MISEIVIRQSEFDSDEDWIVVDSLSKFAIRAGEDGFSTPDLPPEVLWNSQVTNAFGQINRNGPSGYFYNVLAPADGTPRWDLIVDATRKGLDALGDNPQIAGFEKIIAAYEANREAIAVGRKSDSLFKVDGDFDLLCEFMPSSEAEDEFMELRSKWIRSLENLKVVPDQNYEQMVSSLLSR